MVCVIQITGRKDVGKTVLAEKLISLAKSRNLRVLAIKQSHHSPDLPEKDSYRMQSAGADLVLLRGGGMWASFSRYLVLDRLDFDIVIVEGFRDSKLGFKVHIGPDPPADADLVLELEDALKRYEDILNMAKCYSDSISLLKFLKNN